MVSPVTKTKKDMVASSLWIALDLEHILFFPILFLATSCDLKLCKTMVTITSAMKCTALTMCKYSSVVGYLHCFQPFITKIGSEGISVFLLLQIGTLGAN